MTRVIIAYGSQNWFWQTCADLVRESATANSFDYVLVTDDDLTADKVTSSINEGHQPHVLAAFSHGDSQGYTNNQGDYYVDIMDDRLYLLAGHIIYSTTCWSGNDAIISEMKRKGIKAYWGYNGVFRYVPSEEFARCSVAGIISMLEGYTLSESKKIMEDQFSQYKADNVLSAAIVDDNVHRLVVIGESDYKLL